MSKRPETLELERLLTEDTRNGRIYGCEEVTIGFANSASCSVRLTLPGEEPGMGRGNEIVDFMTMDSKGIIKCYELKVTMQDLKSKAKKSWYGHYNYLVVTGKLWQEIKDDIDRYVPKEVGVITGGGCLSSVKKCQKCDISLEQEMLCKESLIRSIYWKMIKYKDAADMKTVADIKKRLRESEKEKLSAQERCLRAERIIDDIETYTFLNTGTDINLAKIAKTEKEKWRESQGLGRKKDLTT